MIFLGLVFSGSSYASKPETYNLSCNGQSTSYADGKKETKPFFDDFKVYVYPEGITDVKLTNTSSWNMRGEWYWDKRLKVNKDTIKIKMDPYKNGDDALESFEATISLSSGNYAGFIHVSTYSKKWNEVWNFKYKIQARCSGTKELFAKINNKNNNLPEIDDNQIITASSGTGFLVSKKGHMVTNYHVIQGCKIVNAIYNNKKFETEVIAVDKVNDLAIIKSNIRPNKVFAVSNKDGQLLEEVIVAGYPLGKKISASIKATTGTITALAGLGDNFAEFQTDAALNSGNSGGPIINEMGNVVGVAVSKIQQEGIDSFNFGIKSSILKIFAEANGLTFLPQNNKVMKKKDLGALITEATIYLDCLMTGKQLKKFLAEQKTSQKAFYTEFAN